MLTDEAKVILQGLSKDRLIKMIEDWDSAFFRISETCVSVSKMDIDSDAAIEKIRKYLRNYRYQYALQNEHLSDFIDYRLGRISGEEYRNRVLGE